MKKILCPTDFSDTSQNAIAYAAKLAQATGSTLTLLNVQSLLNTSLIELHAGKGVVVQAVSAKLEEISNDVHQFFKISCDVEVVESGSALSSAIAERSADYDIIIMGTNGAEDLFEFFTGSTTYHAIQKSKIPVLLIPPDATYSEITSIVYSYNYLGERKLPLTQLSPFIKALKCDLTILQVVDETAINTRHNFKSDSEAMENLQDFADFHHFKNYTLNVRSEHIEQDGILSFAKEINADLITIPTHGRKGLIHWLSGSIAEDIVNHVNCPVWTCGIK